MALKRRFKKIQITSIEPALYSMISNFFHDSVVSEISPGSVENFRDRLCIKNIPNFVNVKNYNYCYLNVGLNTNGRPTVRQNKI